MGYGDNVFVVGLVGVDDIVYVVKYKVIVVDIDVVVGVYLYIVFYVVVLVEGDVDNGYCYVNVVEYYFLLVVG